jgi:hypothetical protein
MSGEFNMCAQQIGKSLKKVLFLGITCNSLNIQQKEINYRRTFQASMNLAILFRATEGHYNIYKK